MFISGMLMGVLYVVGGLIALAYADTVSNGKCFEWTGYNARRTAFAIIIWPPVVLFFVIRFVKLAERGQ